MSLVLAAGVFVPAVPATAQEPTPQDPVAESPAPTPDMPPSPSPADDAEGGMLLIEARGLRPAPAPLFFSARTAAHLRINGTHWESEAEIDLTVLQGKADVFTLSMHGAGEIVAVAGDGALDWAVRRPVAGDGDGGSGEAAGRRLLDIRPRRDSEGNAPATLRVNVLSRAAIDSLPGEFALLTFGPGKAIGFSSALTVTADRSVDLQVVRAAGLVPVDPTGATTTGTWIFQSTGESDLAVRLVPGAAAVAPVELAGLRLEGQLDAAARTVTFVMTGEAHVRPEGGGGLDVLSGNAAFAELPAGAPFRVRLAQPADRPPVYRIEFPSPGIFPVRLVFQAAVVPDSSGWSLDFTVPAGAVVPVVLTGIEDDVRFADASSVHPSNEDGRWIGFLPADGRCALAWESTRTADEGRLFFASDALIETRVGAGLLRQATLISLQLLQGELNGVHILLEGPGEILSVEGGNVLGWSVKEAGDSSGNRLLEVTTARPATEAERLIITSQSPIGEFPITVNPLRLTPQGAVRHSGHIRIVNEGAVRLDVSAVSGMIQLAPEQFPGGPAPEGARQVFVYRFPSAQHAFAINADQITPEVGVSQILVYEMTETDRIINARIELEIREAPLREFELRVPDGYAVAGVSGAEVGDFVHATEAVDGTRALKVLFRQAVQGRQLVQVRLERNVPAVAGPWVLPPVTYPAAKSVRGYIGIAASAGYRVAPGTTDQLTEIPLAYFPEQEEGLQQAFRLRDPAWNAEMTVEALAQSVQADVFHLYSLKEGVAYASVLVNYFVVGAPAGEWRLEVPAEAGNVAVDGQNVQGWRREENIIVATLHQPTLGAATLLLTFEQPMSARGGVLRPGQVRPDGVQGERGFIQVVSPSQVRHEVTMASANLLRMEPLELPAEFRLLTNSPSLAVYQYSARPIELDIAIEWFDPADTADQVVEFTTVSSQVSRDGQVVTDARIFVKTRGRKALRLTLPEGVELWESRVNGAPVNARQDGATTLIPLAATLDPGIPVEVLVRLGQVAPNPRHLRITAPRIEAPALITRWNVKGDAGRQIVPGRGSLAALVSPALTETGYEWLRLRGWQFLLLSIAVAMVGVFWVRAARTGTPLQLLGLLCLGIAAFLTIVLGISAADDRRVQPGELDFVSPVAEAGEPVTLEIRNLPSWEALVSWPGIAAALAGIGILGFLFFRQRTARSSGDGEGGRSSGGGEGVVTTVLFALGWTLLAAGVLAQRGGAIGFWILLALLIGGAALYPASRDWMAAAHIRRNRAPKDAGGSDDDPSSSPGGSEGPPPQPPAPATKRKGTPRRRKGDENQGSAPESASGGATSAIVALALLGAAGVGPVKASEPPPLAADRIIQSLGIEGSRLAGEVVIDATGSENEAMILLKGPAVLTKFQGEGLRVVKRESDGRIDYWAVLERDGAVSATLSYTLALGDLKAGFVLPTGAAAVQSVEIRYDQPGWEFGSPAAVRIEPLDGLSERSSGARLVLGPAAEPRMVLQPRSRDIAAEEARFFVEVANLFVPGPGVVDGTHRVIVRPSRGQLQETVLDVPAGFTVSDVAGEMIQSWRFDPESKSLRVAFSPPQPAPFAFVVYTQQGTGALPAEVTVAPIGVSGAERQVGTLAVAFGPDAQPEKVEASGLSKVNLQDFDADLLPSANGSGEAVVLHEVFRYGQEAGSAVVSVGSVEPEVRVESMQTLSLGDERIVLAADLTTVITRAGLFNLSFALPAGLELESASGDALSHWTESQQDGARIVTLHLNGRTIGRQVFALSFAGPAPGAQPEWTVPRLTVRESTREAGQLVVVPEQGIRAEPVNRSNVSQLDARTVVGNQSGALAFRLLQSDWSLSLRLDALDPWVTVQALQEVTIREGLTRTRLAVAYRVENAAIKTLRVRIPGLTDAEQNTVRASGDAVSDMARVADEDSLWEVRFQRRMLGNGSLTIEFQRGVDRTGGAESVEIAEFPGTSQSAHWVAIRVSGHLDVQAGALGRGGQAGALGRGWQLVDWSGVPGTLVDPRDRSMPALTFRAVEPEQPLSLRIQRHAVAEALSLRISHGLFTTIFSPDGTSVTEARMTVEVVEKGTMRVRLPGAAALFSVFVNGQSAAIVREENAFLFHVSPQEMQSSAEVVVTWEANSPVRGRTVSLEGPRLNVPLQNIEWTVHLPEGYSLADSEGSLELREVSSGVPIDLEHYRDAFRNQRSAEADDATRLFEEASRWKSEGRQDMALSALSRLAKTRSLDQAANEDARIQLRELQTEQAVIGLNTRRQKLYLDNRGEDPSFARNEQLEAAANLNPLLQGQLNYNPGQVDEILQGNTVEENSSLKRIASRLVSQQLAAEPALQSLVVSLPEQGGRATFSRSVQVDGDSPLELNLALSRMRGAAWWFILAVAAAVGATAAVLRIALRPRPSGHQQM